MSVESTRIGELEKTIETLVAYLRRLPINPETYRHANQAEKVLRKRVPDITLSGQKFHPIGLALLTVEMKGLNITVRTQDIAGMSEDFQRKYQADLFDALVQGIDVTLNSE